MNSWPLLNMTTGIKRVHDVSRSLGNPFIFFLLLERKKKTALIDVQSWSFVLPPWIGLVPEVSQ
jgi:hypothetical protein